MAQGALPGFRDFYPEQFAERAHLMGVWREVARRFAFVEYDGPPLESLDLYKKKSGDEIVAQLYNFTDKGGREVALRPEMTPTLARMAAAKANALRKPVRWFSVPQLFRYERQQRGRLREHFQLNVDIIGEADVTADAELLAVAIEIMRSCGLTSNEVHARVSDRLLLHGLLAALGVADAQLPQVFDVVDKVDRRPRDASIEKLQASGMPAKSIESFLKLLDDSSLDDIESAFRDAPGVQERITEIRRYFGLLRGLDVLEWVKFDLKIVRGLAYYSGIVFELFDKAGEMRAICGGGRYDSLLKIVGDTDLPALGFGMGDVVLTDLLRERGLMPASVLGPSIWLAGADSGERSAARVRQVATRLRRAGLSVEYSLRPLSLNSQRSAAKQAGAVFVVGLPTGAESEPAWLAADVPIHSFQDREPRSSTIAALADYLRAEIEKLRTAPKPTA
jgi:histidyl-tRNA synthetase